MSKFFYKDGCPKTQDITRKNYSQKRVVRLGTRKNPAKISVQTQTRCKELSTLAAEKNVVVEVTVDNQQPENIQALEAAVSKTTTFLKEATPARNEPCSCGSGKKYKRCCSSQ